MLMPSVHTLINSTPLKCERKLQWRGTSINPNFITDEHVRFWLLTDIPSRKVDVRFTPETGRQLLGNRMSGYDP